MSARDRFVVMSTRGRRLSARVACGLRGCTFCLLPRVYRRTAHLRALLPVCTMFAVGKCRFAGDNLVRLPLRRAAHAATFGAAVCRGYALRLVAGCLLHCYLVGWLDCARTTYLRFFWFAVYTCTRYLHRYVAAHTATDRMSLQFTRCYAVAGCTRLHAAAARTHLPHCRFCRTLVRSPGSNRFAWLSFAHARIRLFRRGLVRGSVRYHRARCTPRTRCGSRYLL